jgi:hypothetical protein
MKGTTEIFKKKVVEKEGHVTKSDLAVHTDCDKTNGEP